MIRVHSVEAIPITFRLEEGYRIAGRSFTSADNIILKVDTSDGRTGFGCAAPAEDVTGETTAVALLALHDRIIPLLRESDAADTDGIARRAASIAPEAPAARAAADTALHHLVGARARAPLVRVLGMRRDRLPTSITLGLAGQAETLGAARRHVNAGFRILKVKVGEDWQADVRLIRALRQALGPGIVLRADANRGYSEETARRFLEALEPEALELLEQPTPVLDLAAMARLAEGSDVPIMADETILTAADAQRVAEARAADLINIKLMKSGSLGEARAIARIARSSGIGAMIGCMDESRIGIAAALHFALATEGVERADLDGHLDLRNDVAQGGVRIEQGYILPLLDRPGLGVAVSL
jgi:L-Ala-D/L-Glu epimerase / N-acetyl-D-glutamate racemase